MGQVGRRQFLIASGALVVAPLARAQPPGKVYRVGYLTPRSRPASFDADAVGAFVRGLRELSYVEGKNLVIEWRFANGSNERLVDLGAELVRLKVDVILAESGPAARAAQQSTETIPIVISRVGDPVALGFVASLAKPGKNITGVSNLAGDVSSKSLEFLRDMVPTLSRVAVLLNPSTPIAPLVLKQYQTAAKLSSMDILQFTATNSSQIDAAFTAIAQAHPGALIVAPDGYFPSRAAQITELAAKHRIPGIYTSSLFVEAGGLISYAENPLVTSRRAAIYVDRIFKGAEPADLPVEQATQLELAVNLKTAKALGLAIPQSILLRADRVIE